MKEVHMQTQKRNFPFNLVPHTDGVGKVKSEEERWGQESNSGGHLTTLCGRGKKRRNSM